MQVLRMTTLAGRMMLQRSPLFRGLPPAALERITGLAARRALQDGEILFNQGDPGDALYAVVSGRIRISTGTADGRQVFLNIMEPGDTFGEIALLDGGARTAAATAIAPTELVSIRRDHFRGLLEREPPVALELLRLCGQRLRWTSGLLEDAALISLLGAPDLRATAAYLLGRAGFKGYPTRQRDEVAIVAALRQHLDDTSTFDDPFYRRSLRTQDFVIGALVRVRGPERFKTSDPRVEDQIGFALPWWSDAVRAELLAQARSR
jgi:CRP-like cAMP-binding protein